MCDRPGAQRDMAGRKLREATVLLNLRARKPPATGNIKGSRSVVLQIKTLDVSAYRKARIV